METTEVGTSKLITEIEKDARQEAEKIVSEAHMLADERRKYTADQVRSIVRDAEEKARQQTEAITKKILSRVDIEIRRIDMQARNKILSDIMRLVETELRSLIKKPAYKNILKALIIEAAIGLNAEYVFVNASAEEKPFLDNAFLSEVKQKITAVSGQKISLSVADTPPLLHQGVVLTAKEGRLAFNNQIKTRILRKQREIQKLIYDTLFQND